MHGREAATSGRASAAKALRAATSDHAVRCRQYAPAMFVDQEKSIEKQVANRCAREPSTSFRNARRSVSLIASTA